MKTVIQVAFSPMQSEPIAIATTMTKETLKSISGFETLNQFWMSDFKDKHRKGISDWSWMGSQPKGKPKFKVGDLIEFQAGGFGKINEVSLPHDGFPTSYSTRPIDGMQYHPKNKWAWHYELDFKQKIGEARITLHFYEKPA